MLTIDFSDVERKARGLQGAARQVPFLMAYSLTNAMKDAREGEIATMRGVFDRPTPYTLRSLQVTPATKANLKAELSPKEFGGTPAWKYLGPEVQGGQRRLKGAEVALKSAGILKGGEYVVPGAGMKLNAYGNIPGGQITRILSALGASRDASQNTRRRPQRSNRRRNLNYFVHRSGSSAPSGIYLRMGRKAVPVLLFVRGVSYERRFPYYEAARRIVPVAFKKHFQAGWERFVLKELRSGSMT